MIQELWLSLRGRIASPRPSPLVTTLLPDQDADLDGASDDGKVPDWEPQALSGYSCMISYLDARKQASERRVTCQRLDEAAGVRYLRAWCHAREAVRAFRVDRIVAAVDLASGEIFEPGELLFERFTPGHVQDARFNWGMTPRRRADLIAALNVLTFMANCDGEWHPAERALIEDFLANFWLRAEIAAELPEQDIMRWVDDLAPDAETFIVSVHRCRESRLLAPMLRRVVGDLVSADRRHAPEELYWATMIDRIFARD